MGFGRFLCVGVPFGLTLASLVCLIIASFAGVSDTSLDLFQVDMKNLSISTSTITNLENELRRRSLADLTKAALNTDASSVASSATSAASASASSAIASLLGTDGAVNITASELGLADSYTVSLWNYCSTTSKNTTCTKAKFNWAASALNTTTIDDLSKSLGSNTTLLPSSVESALKTFIVVDKWAQVVYIIALIATAAELFLALFAFCSRAGSCITWIISGFSSLAVIVATIMATVLSSVTVGAIKSSAKAYGIQATINTHFLAVAWLAVAFSLASSFFWVFTICCCAADHHKNNRKSRNGGEDAEKLIPQTGAYHRVQEPTHMQDAYGQQQHGVYNTQQHQPVRTGAYEPYAHAAI